MQVSASLLSEEIYVTVVFGICVFGICRKLCIGSLACAIRSKMRSICLERTRTCLCLPAVCSLSMLRRFFCDLFPMYRRYLWILRQSSSCHLVYTCTHKILLTVVLTAVTNSSTEVTSRLKLLIPSHMHNPFYLIWSGNKKCNTYFGLHNPCVESSIASPADR